MLSKSEPGWRSRIVSFAQDRLVLAMVVSLLYAVCYEGAARARLAEPMAWVPTSLDALVPFFPPAIWVYLSIFPLVALALLLPPPPLRAETALAILLAVVIAAAFYLALPLEIARPPVQAAGLTGTAWAWLRRVDTARNVLPSLHAALAVISAQAFRARHGRAARAVTTWAVTAWAVAIVGAALLIRQHYLLDAALGLLLGWSAVRLVRNRLAA